jgi:hypothetical protein
MRRTNLVRCAGQPYTEHIRGLEGSATGMFYTSASCTTGGSKTVMTVPQGSSSLQLYFKNTAAENLAVFFQDSLSQMANSPTINIAISPSTLTDRRPWRRQRKDFGLRRSISLSTLATARTDITAALSPIAP